MSKENLHLPKTIFSMKANLAKKEPDILKQWEKNKTFEKIRKNSKGKEKFVLHDGPPYANGHIHMGTALNKILKEQLLQLMFQLEREIHNTQFADNLSEQQVVLV